MVNYLKQILVIKGIVREVEERKGLRIIGTIETNQSTQRD